MRWSSFLGTDSPTLPEMETAQSRLQRLLETGTLSRINPYEERDGREYSLPALNRVAFGLEAGPGPEPEIRRPKDWNYPDRGRSRPRGKPFKRKGAPLKGRKGGLKELGTPPLPEDWDDR